MFSSIYSYFRGPSVEEQIMQRVLPDFNKYVANFEGSVTWSWHDENYVKAVACCLAYLHPEAVTRFFAYPPCLIAPLTCNLHYICRAQRSLETRQGSRVWLCLRLDQEAKIWTLEQLAPFVITDLARLVLAYLRV